MSTVSKLGCFFFIFFFLFLYFTGNENEMLSLTSFFGSFD